MKYNLYCIYFKNDKRYYGITKYTTKYRVYEHIKDAKFIIKYNNKFQWNEKSRYGVR